MIAALVALPCIALAQTTEPATQPVVRIAPFFNDSAAAVTYTFDDNYRDQYTLAFPILEQYHVKATFFVIPGRTVDTPAEGEAREAAMDKPWGSASWPELKIMSDAGHEIASHTLTHPNLKRLTSEQVEEQIRKAAELIHQHIGKPALTLAYPYNARTSEIQTIMHKYHLGARERQIGVGPGTTAAKLQTWADKLARDHQWGVMMIHAMKKGYAPFDPEVFAANLKYVTSHPELFWVDTFANVLRYHAERESTSIDVSHRPTGLDIRLTSPLDASVYDLPLTLVIQHPTEKSPVVTQDGRALAVQPRNGAILVNVTPAAGPIAVDW